MRIDSITVKNYRPFKLLEEVKLGQFATIVGKNDSGKSSILRAIQLFFEEGKIDPEDFHDGADPNENIVIEIAFTSLPEKIEIENGVATTLKEEMLLDENGNLRIRKTFSRDDEISISLLTQDFQDESFAGLVKLKENELNRRCREKEIEVTKAGRGITNKEKRAKLRNLARSNEINISEYELKLSKRDELWTVIKSLLPDYYLFEAETKTNIHETSFQREFRPIIETVTEDSAIAQTREKFTEIIEKRLQEEIDKIFEKLKIHSSDITALKAKPSFSWEKAVELSIYGKDYYGIDKPLEKRGSGIRRLLMVAFFEYLAEREKVGKISFIFGLEEPENNLHPGLQRELARSFRQIIDKGYQIIITTHSPVFAGASPIEDLTLIMRERGIAKAIQSPNLNYDKIAEELGVEPADQILGYRACVFVEGPNDILFWKSVASKLKHARHILYDFNDREIGLLPGGGSNLKSWINMRAMKKLNRKFAVIVDSDRKSPNDRIPQEKLNCKEQCELDGGIFIILRKRAIENYLHPDALSRANKPAQQFNDFTDMKKLFGKNVIEVIKDMSADEILQMDSYVDENRIEHHELKEIVEKLINLVN
jgi:predicted ATP-dependent endonuclease of OLD family